MNFFFLKNAKPRKKRARLRKELKKLVSHMEMNIHHDGKTVDIWLTKSEARDEIFRNSLEPYYRQFAKHKYFVSVFESGDRELLSDTTLLLRHNLELQMKAEPATEQVQA